VDGTVTIQSDNPKDRRGSLAVANTAHAQRAQIKTSVRATIFFPADRSFSQRSEGPQARRFLGSFFSLILRLRVNRSWPLTDLRDGLPRMCEKKKQNANAGRWARRGFKIRKDPMVRLAKADNGLDVPDWQWPERPVCGQPFLSPRNVMHTLSRYLEH